MKQLETSPSRTLQFPQSDMASPTPVVEQRTESTSSSNPVSSTSELMASPDDFIANQRSLSQYVPAGTPGTPTRTEFPLLTTFPTNVRASVLPDLASSAGDQEGMNDRSVNSDVVSAILSEDSRNGFESFESVETLATGISEEENELNRGESTDKDRPALHTSQSMPVLMPPSSPIPVVEDDAGKPVVGPALDSSPHGSIEESVHLIQKIYAGSGISSQGETIFVFLLEVGTVYSRLF